MYKLGAFIIICLTYFYFVEVTYELLVLFSIGFFLSCIFWNFILGIYDEKVDEDE